MATVNPFDLLGDDAEDPSQLIAAEQEKVVAAPKKAAALQAKAGTRAQAQLSKPAQLPAKPPPPAQAVREARNETSRGGRGGGWGYGHGRGGGSGFSHDSSYDDYLFTRTRALAGQVAFEEGDTGKQLGKRGYVGPRGPFRGGRRGGFSNGEVGEGRHPQRVFERQSGTGHGNQIKREGAGRGNWGTQTDELAQVSEEGLIATKKNLADEKPTEEDVVDGNKENPAVDIEEQEPQDTEMTLEEYEKVLEEKRKALQAIKTEERKVDVREFESMHQLSSKKDNNDIFIKLGSDKDKRKEIFEKEEKSKKSVSIIDFLKPAEGERYYNQSGRGRGRGRGRGSRGGDDSNPINHFPAPSIEDPGQFPTLGGGK